MKRLTMPALLALLSAFMAIPGCGSIYADCVKPEIGKITWTGTATELGDMVIIALQCDPNFDPAAAPVCALDELRNLEAVLGPDGKATIDCIIAKIEGNPSASAQLRGRAHAVGVVRQIHQSLICPPSLEKDFQKNAEGEPGQPGTPAGGAPRVPAGVDFAYAGETVAAAQARCEASCGGPDAIGSPGADCLCGRIVGGRLTWAAR